MIQATNTPLSPQDTVTTKVHGFARPSTCTLATSELSPNKKYLITERIFRWWHKIAILLLIVNALIGIWDSIKFIAFEYKGLEAQLTLHQIHENDVNNLIVKAIIVAFTTFINLFMFFRLNKVEEKTANNIDLFVATLLIIGTKFIQETLIQFNLLNIINKLL